MDERWCPGWIWSGRSASGLRPGLTTDRRLLERDAGGNLLVDDAQAEVQSPREPRALSADVVDGQARNERGDVAERAHASFDIVQLALPRLDAVVDHDVREGGGAVQECGGEGCGPLGVECGGGIL